MTKMKIYQYKCKLLSDLIITSSSATEGFNQSLDYIPGAKFLGIVAGQLYKEKDSLSVLDLFHNGNVRYSDAHPLVDGNVGLKVPFKWFCPKGAKLTEKIYLHTEKLSNEIWKEKQPKQARVGYYIPTSDKEGKWLKIDQGFSIKSAYDPKSRKSKDAQMYGYFSLKKGTEWSFTIEDLTDKYAEEIKTTIIGKKRVGRSRSAEYGLVEIEFLSEVPKKVDETINEGIAYIYAKSNLCFYNRYGRNTTTPDASQLMLPDGSSILWDQSQIRTRTYQTWNRKRYNRDADRMIIEKGSVFAVKLSESIGSSQIENGIGAHQSEGFGQVLLNPSFLQSDTAELDFSITKIGLDDWGSDKAFFTVETCNNDMAVVNYLAQQKAIKKQTFDIDERVNNFIKTNADFTRISNSQWGIIRNYAKYAFDNDTFEKLLFSPDFGYMYRGQSEKVWRTKNRRKTLHEYLFKSKDFPESHIIPFTIKLATQIAKSK
jgi:hypothetical protein